MHLTIPLEEICQFLEELVASQFDQLFQRIDKFCTVTGPAVTGSTVMGINPNSLYTAAFVAKRWDYDNVETIRVNKDLLRAPWRGKGIRYRGADILRYEGLADDEIFGINDTKLSYKAPSFSSEQNVIPLCPKKQQPKATRKQARTSTSQRPQVQLPSLDQ